MHVESVDRLNQLMEYIVVVMVSSTTVAMASTLATISTNVVYLTY